jgi:hypothetical protein
MKINGLDETNHKIFGEIERNRNFIKKIKEAEDAVDSNAVENQPEKRLKLDTAAAMRMVKPFINPTKMDAETGDAQSKPKEVKTGEVRKLNKGSILPKRDHLNWKEQLEKMQD